MWRVFFIDRAHEQTCVLRGSGVSEYCTRHPHTTRILHVDPCAIRFYPESLNQGICFSLAQNNEALRILIP